MPTTIEMNGQEVPTRPLLRTETMRLVEVPTRPLLRTETMRLVEAHATAKERPILMVSFFAAVVAMGAPQLVTVTEASAGYDVIAMGDRAYEELVDRGFEDAEIARVGAAIFADACKRMAGLARVKEFAEAIKGGTEAQGGE